MPQNKVNLAVFEVNLFVINDSHLSLKHQQSHEITSGLPLGC